MKTAEAEDLLKIVRELFSPLRTKNIFKPKVLTKVSRNDWGLIGSSIAVSSFLRPLYLHKRVLISNRDFGRRLSLRSLCWNLQMIKQRWIVGPVLHIKANLMKTLILTRKFVVLSRKLLVKTVETCSRD